MNNWTQPELDHITQYAESSDEVLYLVAGREVGASNTPHLQGFVAFTGRKTLTQVKSILSSRIHLEVTRGTPTQAITYCKKDGNFVEFGSPPQAQGNRSDWDAFKSYVLDLGRVPNDLEVAGNFPSLFARYPNACRTIAAATLPRIRLVPEGSTLNDWQGELYAILNDDCVDNRTIHFYCDPEGNSGKSFFCAWMLDNESARTQVLGVGKITDIAYMLDPEKDIVLIDCERSASEFLQYRVLEQMKNRLVTSTKYSAYMKLYRKIPHVVVFMNEDPNMNALSTDRYNVVRLN